MQVGLRKQKNATRHEVSRRFLLRSSPSFYISTTKGKAEIPVGGIDEGVADSYRQYRRPSAAELSDGERRS